jgi:hypothetical protein
VWAREIRDRPRFVGTCKRKAIGSLDARSNERLRFLAGSRSGSPGCQRTLPYSLGRGSFVPTGLSASVAARQTVKSDRIVPVRPGTFKTSAGGKNYNRTMADAFQNSPTTTFSRATWRRAALLAFGAIGVAAWAHANNRQSNRTNSRRLIRA